MRVANLPSVPLYSAIHAQYEIILYYINFLTKKIKKGEKIKLAGQKFLLYMITSTFETFLQRKCLVCF